MASGTPPRVEGVDLVVRGVENFVEEGVEVFCGRVEGRDFKLAKNTTSPVLKNLSFGAKMTIVWPKTAI